jgi:thymidylate synthase (FAD)
VWTTSLQAVLHFIELRRGAGAQSEIALYAEAISELISPIVPEVLRTYMELSQK